MYGAWDVEYIFYNQWVLDALCGLDKKVMQLKNQGMADAQIIGALQQQGISPKEINDAISQAQIKSAVGSPEQPQQMEQSITEGAAPAPIAETQAVEINTEIAYDDIDTILNVKNNNLASAFHQLFKTWGQEYNKQTFETASENRL